MAPEWKSGSRSTWMHFSSSQKSFTGGMPPAGPDHAIGDNGSAPGSTVVGFTYLSVLLMVPLANFIIYVFVSSSLED